MKVRRVVRLKIKWDPSEIGDFAAPASYWKAAARKTVRRLCLPVKSQESFDARAFRKRASGSGILLRQEQQVEIHAGTFDTV
jgi:hypothetical protein